MNKIKRKAAVLLIAALAVMMLGGIEAKAAGGSSSMSVSSSSVNIGDSVTVTLSVSADVYASFRMSVSYSSSILEYTGADKSGDCNGGGGSLSVLSEVSAGGTYSISINFKAIAPGNASLSASAVEAVAMDPPEAISISGASASVTVNNAASGGGTDGGGTDGGTDGGDAGGTTTQSGDNSLKSLTISPGTLSPSFKYSTTKYTAKVNEDVTSIAVDAQVSNANATVESVTGNTNLQMGENTVKIVVKAENGTTATYTIVVTRGGAATEEPEDEDEDEGDEEETPDTGIVINGVTYEVSQTLPEDAMPEEFTKTTTTYGDQEVEAYSFQYDGGVLLLFYLNQADSGTEGEEETGGFYFLNEQANEFFPYINIPVGEKYVLVLPLSYVGSAVPEGYQESVITIKDFMVNGYQLIGEDAELTNDFYLVCGAEKGGAVGWYQYDAVDMSLQRFVETVTVTQEPPQADTSAYEKALAELEEKYTKEKSSARIIMAVLIFLLVVSIVAIINIIIFAVRGRGPKRKKGKNDDMDYIDFDDL